MDDVAVGRGFRALRRRKGWSQRELGAQAGLNASVVSDVEIGRLELVRLPTLRRLGKVLGIAVQIQPRWPVADVARLLDRDHAALVEQLVTILRSHGWEVLVEYTFNDYGDRGSVDVLAWHPTARALLLVEVKTRIVDLQDALASFDRKVRVVPNVLRRERGWQPKTIGRLLVVMETHGNRLVVRRHEEIFQIAFPGRSRDARRWIREPAQPLAALWFLPGSGASRDKGAAGSRAH